MWVTVRAYKLECMPPSRLEAGEWVALFIIVIVELIKSIFFWKLLICIWCALRMIYFFILYIKYIHEVNIEIEIEWHTLKLEWDTLRKLRRYSPRSEWIRSKKLVWIKFLDTPYWTLHNLLYRNHSFKCSDSYSVILSLLM